MLRCILTKGAENLLQRSLLGKDWSSFQLVLLFRSEIAHLTGLLQSKAGGMSHGDEHEKETTSVFDRHEKVAAESPVENRNKGIRSNVSTPIFSSKVLEDDIDSPADLQKLTWAVDLQKFYRQC